MTHNRMLDFLTAMVNAAPEMSAPKIGSVRLQVRTGGFVPPKPEMFETGYFVLSWKYRVKDTVRFHEFLHGWEENFRDFFQRLTVEKDRPTMGTTHTIRLGYHGTFGVRPPSGAVTNHFKTLWGGEYLFIEIIERCYRGRPRPRDSEVDEVKLTKLIAELLRHVSGNVDIEILDPTIGFT